MNPFELHGASYLTFYMSALFFGAVSALFIRHLILSVDRQPLVSAEAVARQLDPYEAAYIEGGNDRAFLTACATLARHEIVSIDRTGREITLVPDKEHPHLHELEQTLVFKLKLGPLLLADAKKDVSGTLATVRRRLVDKNLATDDSTKSKASLMPWLWFAAITLLFSVPKIEMAIAENRPHGFLVLLAVIAGIMSFFFLKKADLTNKGRMAGLILKQNSSALQLTAQSNPTSLSLRDTAMAYGLFGAMAVAGDFFFADAAYALRPVPGTGGSGCSSSGCGSSCGSSCGGGCGGGCGG